MLISSHAVRVAQSDQYHVDPTLLEPFNGLPHRGMEILHRDPCQGISGYLAAIAPDQRR